MHLCASAEALNQGENVDLDALMADLSSIELELSTINSKPNGGGGGMARLGLTDAKVPLKASFWCNVLMSVCHI